MTHHEPYTPGGTMWLYMDCILFCPLYAHIANLVIWKTFVKKKSKEKNVFADFALLS